MGLRVPVKEKYWLTLAWPVIDGVTVVVTVTAVEREGESGGVYP
jgi:hypothetical protein